MGGFPPPSSETTLLTGTFDIERKRIIVQFKENSRGRFVRVVEEGAKGRNSVIIPEEGIHKFLAHIEEIAQRCKVPQG